MGETTSKNEIRCSLWTGMVQDKDNHGNRDHHNDTANTVKKKYQSQCGTKHMKTRGAFIQGCLRCQVSL